MRDLETIQRNNDPHGAFLRGGCCELRALRALSIAVGSRDRDSDVRGKRGNFVKRGSCIGSVFINDHLRRQALFVRLTTRVPRARRGEVHSLINDGIKISLSLTK